VPMRRLPRVCGTSAGLLVCDGGAGVGASSSSLAARRSRSTRLATKKNRCRRCAPFAARASGSRRGATKTVCTFDVATAWGNMVARDVGAKWGADRRGLGFWGARCVFPTRSVLSFSLPSALGNGPRADVLGSRKGPLRHSLPEAGQRPRTGNSWVRPARRSSPRGGRILIIPSRRPRPVADHRTSGTFANTFSARTCLRGLDSPRPCDRRAPVPPYGRAFPRLRF